MSKQIRINDDVYEVIESYAKKNRRSIPNAVEFLLEKIIKKLDGVTVDPKDVYTEPGMTTLRKELAGRGMDTSFLATAEADSPYKKNSHTSSSTPEEENIYSQSLANRTKSDVLTDINLLKTEWADDISPQIVQDAETLAKNKRDYEEAKQRLWDEYHQLLS